MFSKRVNVVIPLLALCMWHPGVISTSKNDNAKKHCSRGWTPYYNEGQLICCYELFNADNTWYNAKKRCDHQKASMLTISDNFEQEFILEKMESHNVTRLWVLAKDDQQQESIGLCPIYHIEKSKFSLDVETCSALHHFVCEKAGDDSSDMDSSGDGNGDVGVITWNLLTVVPKFVDPAPGEECRPNYCYNGATCTVISVEKHMGAVTGISDINCKCRKGFGGDACQHELDMLIYTYATMRFLIDYNPVFADSKNTQTRQLRAGVIKEIRLAIRQYTNALFFNLVSIRQGSVIAVFEVGFMTHKELFKVDKENIKDYVMEALSSEASDGFIGGLSVDQTSIVIVSQQTDENNCLRKSMPCQNEAECLDGDKHYICLCHPQYHGEFCEHTNSSYTADNNINGKHYKYMSPQISSASHMTGLIHPVSIIIILMMYYVICVAFPY